MNIKEFKDSLGVTMLPVELEKLVYFQTNISGFELYSQGFGLMVDDKSGLKSWSKDPSFLNKLMPFAQANGTGSFYAFWIDGPGRPLNELPVVVFGDEGGVHVVAEHLLQLLHLLTYDAEISVDFDEAYFYRDMDSYEESEDLTAYLEWMEGDYGLKQIEDPDTLIKTARDTYKPAFDQWLSQYVKE